jgi:hypothetical protein
MVAGVAGSVLAILIVAPWGLVAHAPAVAGSSRNAVRDAVTPVNGMTAARSMTWIGDPAIA